MGLNMQQHRFLNANHDTKSKKKKKEAKHSKKKMRGEIKSRAVQLQTADSTRAKLKLSNAASMPAKVYLAPIQAISTARILQYRWAWCIRAPDQSKDGIVDNADGGRRGAYSLQGGSRGLSQFTNGTRNRTRSLDSQ